MRRQRMRMRTLHLQMVIRVGRATVIIFTLGTDSSVRDGCNYSNRGLSKVQIRDRVVFNRLTSPFPTGYRVQGGTAFV